MAVPWSVSPEPIRELSGGVVAYNEEANLRGAVRSLLDQHLPDGVRWRNVWVVASGCTDGTVGVAETLASEDPRIRVLVESDRGGKARALGAVFARAEGDALVLLNSDARAEPGAVAHLVSVASGKSAPYAVMGRPVVPATVGGPLSPMLRWMWELHHEFHLELLADGRGGHLSDELLLLSLPTVVPPPAGTINDGSYLAVWLAQHAGGRWYAPDARVAIQIPSRLRDHLHQRRRIHVGNGQVASLLRTPPATIPEQFFRRPAATLRLLRRLLARPNGVRDFGRLAAAELASYGLAAWDLLPPRRDHVRWQRIELPSSGSAPSAPAESETRDSDGTERRVAAMLRVARQFDTGLDLARLRDLLPADGPATPAAVERWILERPTIGRLDAGRIFAPEAEGRGTADRERRAAAYRRYATAVVEGPLGFAAPLVRCVGVSGSVAYGEARPGDDLDLFVVPRTGALWWFLLRAYVHLRLAPPVAVDGERPEVCLNYVVEDASAAREFAARDGLLYAREALSVRAIAGDPYYRGLLASAPWMRSELPRLWDQRSADPGGIDPQPAPRGIRLLNALVFPFLATYLQLVGLVRSSHGRRARGADGEFRTETALHRVAFASRRFERLRSDYGERRSVDSPADATPAPSGAPAAR